MARFGGVKASAFAVVQAIAAFAEKKLVHPGLLGSYEPSSYPAAVCAALDPERLGTAVPPSPGHTSHRFKCRFAIVIHAASDGAELGDALDSAETLVDAVIDAFSSPVWIPGSNGIAVDATCWPCDIEGPKNTILDAGRVATLVIINAEIEWRT
jgi:hypothetical protein